MARPSDCPRQISSSRLCRRTVEKSFSTNIHIHFLLLESVKGATQRNWWWKLASRLIKFLRKEKSVWLFCPAFSARDPIKWRRPCDIPLATIVFVSIENRWRTTRCGRFIRATNRVTLFLTANCVESGTDPERRPAPSGMNLCRSSLLVKVYYIFTVS